MSTRDLTRAGRKARQAAWEAGHRYAEENLIQPALHDILVPEDLLQNAEFLHGIADAFYARHRELIDEHYVSLGKEPLMRATKESLGKRKDRQ
jgi:hypothetical protein